MDEYTHPDVFTIGVAQGWADAETDPTRINWVERRAGARILFSVVDGRPVNPCEWTAVRYGRNRLGRWGENLMADALVTASFGGCRWLLMVERGDGAGWAVPGGAVESGETPTEASARELTEETGLVVASVRWSAGEPRYVPDPRASDEAWAVTVPATADLGIVDRLPEVVGADDARRAAWVRADTYADLKADLAYRFGGWVFAAHVAMLTDFLAALGPPGRYVLREDPMLGCWDIYQTTGTGTRSNPPVCLERRRYDPGDLTLILRQFIAWIERRTGTRPLLRLTDDGAFEAVLPGAAAVLAEPDRRK